MTTRTKVISGGVGGGLLLIVALLGFHFWLLQHDALIGAQADAKATKEAFAKLQEDRDAERTAEIQRDKDRDAQNAATLAEVTKLKTPAQKSAYVNREVPGANAMVTRPAADKTKPDAPQPKEQVIVDADALDARLAKCRIAENSLSTCQQDIAGRDRDAKKAQEQIDLLKKSNDKLQSDLKGGTWFHRTVRALKIAACAGAGGAAGSGKGAAGGAIGAFAGAVVCTLASK